MKHLLVALSAITLLLAAYGGGADPVFQTTDFVDHAPGEVSDAPDEAPVDAS
jgi:hypothetical protein